MVVLYIPFFKTGHMITSFTLLFLAQCHQKQRQYKLIWSQAHFHSTVPLLFPAGFLKVSRYSDYLSILLFPQTKKVSPTKILFLK